MLLPLQTRSSCPRDRIMQLSVVLQCLCLLLISCVASTEPLLVTDADMGISTYNSIIKILDRYYNVRVHLRILCRELDINSSSSTALSLSTSSTSSSGLMISAHGYVFVHPLQNRTREWAADHQHYVADDIQQYVRLLFRSREKAFSARWFGDKKVGGLWRFKAHLEGSGPFQLSVGGADTISDLPQPICQQQQQQRPGTPNLAGGIWNVLTTTSNTSLDVKSLAMLLLQHHNYHRSLGFAGTILRSNLHESRALLRMWQIERAVKDQGLIIWPWEHEHMANFSTHFWQQPKNQLTLLGTYDRGARIAFFDFDEFLVLPGNASVHSQQCHGRPLLDPGLDNRMGSWTFLRFQARTCGGVNDMTCWEAGQIISGRDDIPVHMDICPMSTNHGKLIMVSDMVDIPIVHHTFSEHFEGNHIINDTCGHLLHFFNLLGSRREVVSKIVLSMPKLTWSFNPATGRRVITTPAGFHTLTFEECAADPHSRANALRTFRNAQMQLTATATGTQLKSGQALARPAAVASAA